MRKWLIPVTLALALLSGCKKKPQSAPPPQAQAPTVTEPEQTAPAQQPPTEQPPETPTPTQPSTETEPATTTPPPKPKPKPRRSTTASNHKPTQTDNKPVQQATNNPPPAVTLTPAPAPAPSPPPLAPDIPHDQAELQRRSTDQLLETTEYNLRSLHRALSTDEQQIVQQIRNFMQQARSAQTDGDVVRAKNLALKAHQLSDALVTP